MENNKNFLKEPRRSPKMNFCLKQSLPKAIPNGDNRWEQACPAFPKTRAFPYGTTKPPTGFSAILRLAQNEDANRSPATRCLAECLSARRDEVRNQPVPYIARLRRALEIGRAPHMSNFQGTAKLKLTAPHKSELAILSRCCAEAYSLAYTLRVWSRPKVRGETSRVSPFEIA